MLATPWRRIMSTLAGILLYFAFYPSIKNFSLFVALKTFFTVSNEHLWLDGVALLLVLMSIALIYVKWKAFTPKRFSRSWDGVIVVLFLGVYLVHRLNILPGQHWTFTAFKHMGAIKHADAIVLLILVCLLRWQKKSSFSNGKDNPLQEDDYFNTSKKDILFRQDYAQHIAALINGQQTNNSFAIGITGNWGSGKSVFLCQIRDYVSKAEVIEFNPWLSKTPDNMVADFFELVAETIQPYSADFSVKLKQYARSLQEVEGTVKIKLAHLFKEDNAYMALDGQRRRLKKDMIKYRLKLVIIIDDLDRLSSNEILAIMKIVRNSFNLPNVFFLIAYDREYISEALKKENITQPGIYLQKIFQLDIDLPALPVDHIKPELILLLTGKIDYFKKEIITALDEIERHVGFMTIAQNMRESIRLANSFTHNIQKKAPQVNIADLLALEILKVNDYKTYADIRSQLTENLPTVFLKISPEKNERISFLVERSRGIANRSQRLVSFLFNRPLNNDYKSLNIIGNSIRYFSDHLFGKIPFDEFDYYRTHTEPGPFQEFILRFKDKPELEDVLLRNTSINDQIALRNFVKGFLLYCNTTNKIELANRIYILVGSHEHIWKRDDQFIFDILQTTEYPIAEMKLTRLLLTSDRDEVFRGQLHIDKEQINTIKRKYFTNYMASAEFFNPKWQDLYEYSIIDQKSEDKEINSIVKTYITRFALDYFNSRIDPQNDMVKFDDTVENYMTWEEYEDLMDRQVESLSLLKIKSLYFHFKKNNFRGTGTLPKTIYIISDDRTYFEFSDMQPKGIHKRAVLSKYHNEYYNAEKFEALQYASWITHNEDLPLLERKKGGIYTFSRTFDLSGISFNINTAIMCFMIDDYMSFRINDGKFSGEFSHGDTTYQPIRVDIKSQLNLAGPNSITFNVRNKEAPGDDRPDLINPVNPYAFIYKIALE